MSRNFGYNVLGLGGSGGDGGANRSTRQCIQLTISGTTQNYNIYSNRGGTYVAGKSDVTLTVQAIVGSAGTGQYAIDTGNQWTSGDTVKIINNSQIVGAGGAAGAGGQGFPPSSFPGSNGSAAGHAINLGFATTIQNNGGNIRGGEAAAEAAAVALVNLAAVLEMVDKEMLQVIIRLEELDKQVVFQAQVKGGKVLHQVYHHHQQMLQLEQKVL